jgi:hypothetical protein
VNTKKKKSVRKKINSRTKGKVGELEFAHFLRDEFKIEARRGQQFQGGNDSPDIITSLRNVHFEVKRTETLSLYKAMEQAKNDCGDKIPVVAHRKSRQEWLIVLHAKDLEKFSFEFVNRNDKDESQLSQSSFDN